MIAIASEAYYALSSQEQFDVAMDAYVNTLAKPGHDLHAARWLEQEIYALRVDCSMGPPGRPDLANPMWDVLHDTFIRSAGLGGGITLWGPSKAQKEDLLNVFDADRRDGIPGRYIIVKTRRVGGSLTTGRWAMTRTCRREGQKLLVMAHDVPSAEEIFKDIYKTTWENDPLQPDAKYANKRELFFEKLGSSARVMPVVGGEGKGAGTGYHAVLLSEFLRFEEYGVDIADLVTNLTSTMPQNVETFFAMESSGRGDGGVAYEWCQEAHADPTNSIMGRVPDGGWRCIFLPSYKRWDAERDFESPAERRELIASLNDPDHAEEKFYVEEFKVSLEHINWRRWYERTQIKAKNDKHRKALMRQEAPMTFMDCFQSKGASEFDADRIRELMLTKEVEDGPAFSGMLESSTSLYESTKYRFAVKTPMPTLRKSKDMGGEILFWEESVNTLNTLTEGVIPHRYCMGVDIAEGAVEEDDNDNAYSVASVHDRDTKKLVALYRGKAQHDELLEIVRLLSKWYNDAYICNEVNRFKKWTEDLASTDRRKFMYIRREGRASIGHDTEEAFGWLTTPSSKDDLVEAGHHILHYVPQWIRSKVILEEFRTFKREPKGQRRGKRKGIHDDTFISVTLSWYCDRDMPKLGKDPLVPDQDNDPKGRTPLDKQWDQWKKEQKQAAAGANKGPSRAAIFKGQV